MINYFFINRWVENKFIRFFKLLIFHIYLRHPLACRLIIFWWHINQRASKIVQILELLWVIGSIWVPGSTEVWVIGKSKFDQISLHLQISLDQLIRDFVNLWQLLLDLCLWVAGPDYQILSYLVSDNLLRIKILEHFFSAGNVLLFE